MNVTVMPIITGALGTIPKDLIRGPEELEIGGWTESEYWEESWKLDVTAEKDHQWTVVWKTRNAMQNKYNS